MRPRMRGRGKAPDRVSTDDFPVLIPEVARFGPVKIGQSGDNVQDLTI